MNLAEIAADLSRMFGFPVPAEIPLACEGMPIDGPRGTAAGEAAQGTLLVGAGCLWLNTNSSLSPVWYRLPGISVHQQQHEQETNESDPCSEPTVTSGSPADA